MKHTLVLLLLALASCGSSTGTPTPSNAAPTATEDEDDLAVLRTADRATVLHYGARRGVADTSREVSGPALTVLVAGIVPGQAQAWGGILEGKITFHRDAEIVGDVWVGTYGEWGFTSDETEWLGTSKTLLSVLD